MVFMAIHYGSDREREENAARITKGRFLRQLWVVPFGDDQLLKVKTAADVLAAIRRLQEVRKTYPEECWTWGGQTQKIHRTPTKYGSEKDYKYPKFKELLPNGSSRYIPAKRYAFLLINGYRPLSHEIIRNVCGTELCVNPSEGHNIITTREDWRTDVAMAEAKQIVKTSKSAEELVMEARRNKARGIIVRPNEAPTPDKEKFSEMVVFADEWNEAGGEPFVGETPEPGKIPTEEEFLASFKKDGEK